MINATTDTSSKSKIMSLNESLQVMMEREARHYGTVEYLGINEERQRQQREMEEGAPLTLVTCSGDKDSIAACLTASKAVPADWSLYLAKREAIVKWGYDVTDHFDVPREAVAMAMNYLDRMVMIIESKESHPVVMENYQFLALTCLFMACKLVHKTNGRYISVEQMAALTRGHYTVDAIVKMESKILKDLNWFVHPPTSAQFIMNYMASLGLDSTVFATKLQDSSYFLVEQAVLDYYFVDHCPSVIAIAALANTMQDLLPEKHFVDPIKSLVGLGICPNDFQCIRQCRERFYRLSDSFDEPPPPPTVAPATSDPSKNSSVHKRQRINSPINVMHHSG